MRLKLLLETKGPTLIPWDYRAQLIGTVYKVLSLADPAYTHWLHTEGFKREKKVYRLFVFSDLIPRHFLAQKEGLYVSEWITWELASPDTRFVEKFREGLKKNANEIKLLGNTFEVVDILQTEFPSFSGSLLFRTISPIVVSTFNPEFSQHPIYLEPDQPEFTIALERNLIAKWEAFYGRNWKRERPGIRVWEPQKKLITVFNINVKAWHLKVQIWGPEELVRFAYNAGLGEKNSQGFGMLEVGR